MGIRFYCPNGHKLHVKAFQAGMRGICPYCGAKVQIPLHSTRPSTKEMKRLRAAQRQGAQPATSHAEAAPAASPQAETPVETASGDFDSSPARPFENFEDFLTQDRSQGLQEPEAGFHSMPLPLDALLTGSNEAASESEAAAPPVPPPFTAMSGSPPDDPLADPDVVWYVRPPTGGQYGPAAPQVIRAWIAEARITPDTLVWREGWRDWREAREVFPSLGGAEFPQVPPEELPEMRFIRSSEGFHRRQTVALFVGILATIILSALAIWWFFQASGSP